MADPIQPPISDAPRSQPGPSGQEVQNEAREKAGELKQAATDRARAEANKHKQTVASDLKSVGEALEQSKERADTTGGWAGSLLGEAATRLQAVGAALETKEPDELLRDTRQFARSNPAMFLAGCAGLGFVASRLMQASSDHRNPLNEATRSAKAKLQSQGSGNPRRSGGTGGYASATTTAGSPTIMVPPAGGPR